MVSVAIKNMEKYDKIGEISEIEGCFRWLLQAVYVVICLVVLMGCGVESDLKDIELVSAIGIDVVCADGESDEESDEKSDDINEDDVGSGQKVLVTLQLLKRDKALEAQYAESYYTLQAAGENIAGAIGELYREGAHHLNFSHTSLLILGENAANTAVWLDNAMRSAELRPTVYPVVVQGRAADVMTAGDVPQAAIYTLANIMEPMVTGEAGYAGVTLQEFLTAIMQPGMSAVLPCVSLTDDDETMHLDGFVAFDNDGAPDTGRLSEVGELGWLLLRRHRYMEGYVLCVESGVLELGSVKVCVKMIQGEDMRLACQIECKMKILEKSDEFMENPEIGRLAEVYLYDVLAAALSESCELGKDYLGVGREVYRKTPDGWEKFQENGENYLDLIDIDWNVDVVIQD